MTNTDRITRDLYSLSEDLIRAGHETTGGLLGGEFGYGAFVDNDVFMMHPFCWCEGADCPWCAACECGDDSVRYWIGDRQVTGGEFYGDGFFGDPARRYEPVPENQCANCKRGDDRFAANFLHKRTGTSVRWYKYIGRGMEIDVQGDWSAIIAECRKVVAGDE